MIVRPHGGAAGVEVFKNNERQAAAIVERASSPLLHDFYVSSLLARRRRSSFQLPGFLSNKGDWSIVCLGAQVLG
jgi:hypothetical protein